MRPESRLWLLSASLLAGTVLSCTAGNAAHDAPETAGYGDGLRAADAAPAGDAPRRGETTPDLAPGAPEATRGDAPNGAGECVPYCAWSRACAVATCDPDEGEDCSQAAFDAHESTCLAECTGWLRTGGAACGEALRVYFGDCLAQDTCGSAPPLGCLRKMDDFYSACQGAPLSDVCRDFCAVPASGCYPYTEIGVRPSAVCEAACRASLGDEPCKAAVYALVDCVRSENDLVCGITGPPALPCLGAFRGAATACNGFAPSGVVPAEEAQCAAVAAFRCRCGSAFGDYDPSGCAETLTWACLFDIATRPECPAELATYLHDCLEPADCEDYRRHLVCHDDPWAAAWDCF